MEGCTNFCFFAISPIIAPNLQSKHVHCSSPHLQSQASEQPTEIIFTSPLAKLTEKVCPSSSLGTTTAPASCWLLRHRPFLDVNVCLINTYTIINQHVRYPHNQYHKIIFPIETSHITQLTYPQADGTLACQLQAPRQTICIATLSPHL